MFGNVLRRSGALRRVGEAQLIDVVLVGNDIGRGGRRGEHEHAVVISFRGDRDAGAGSDRADDHLRAPVPQGIIGIDARFRIVLVILHVELNLDAAQRVDFINGDLRALSNGRAVAGGRASHRADQADFDGRFFFGERAANHGQSHDGGKNQSQKCLSHVENLLQCTNESPRPQTRAYAVASTTNRERFLKNTSLAFLRFSLSQ